MTSIIAIMLGRLRLTVDDSIGAFRRIWDKLSANTSMLERVIPLRRAKSSNSETLERALKMMVDDRTKLIDLIIKNYYLNGDLSISHREYQTREFASDPELCKTQVIPKSFKFPPTCI